MSFCKISQMGSSPISSEDAAVITVDAHEARSLLNSGSHLYLDVRTEEEFKKGHLENARNIPFMFFTPQGKVRNPEFEDQVLNAYKKDDLILVGCQGGGRSLKACGDLLGAGFKNVKNVGGGYGAWVKNGFPLEEPEEELENFM